MAFLGVCPALIGVRYCQPLIVGFFDLPRRRCTRKAQPLERGFFPITAYPLSAFVQLMITVGATILALFPLRASSRARSGENPWLMAQIRWSRRRAPLPSFQPCLGSRSFYAIFVLEPEMDVRGKRTGLEKGLVHCGTVCLGRKSDRLTNVAEQTIVSPDSWFDTKSGRDMRIRAGLRKFPKFRL